MFVMRYQAGLMDNTVVVEDAEGETAMKSTLFTGSLMRLDNTVEGPSGFLLTL